MHFDHRIKILWLIVLAAVVAVFNFAPIPQDPAYHRFADQRTLAGLPNFWNVVSNMPFLIVGVLGLQTLVRDRSAGASREVRWMQGVFFAGVFLTGLGSSYYHLQPNHLTLVWDRLPMTIAFMALFSAIVGEYVSARAARTLFLPLLIAGLGSVVYWHWSELNGQGDLRPYALVQFLPMLLIPAILWLFGAHRPENRVYWLMFAAYALSKLAETLDAGLYRLTGEFSGHTLKHLLAAAAPLMYCRALRHENHG